MSNTSPSTGSLEDHSGKLPHVSTVSQMRLRGLISGRSPASYSCCFVSCYTIFYDDHNYLQPKSPHGLYHSFRRIHLISVVSSIGSVEAIDQQSPKPSFNPLSHQPTSPLSPSISHTLSTVVSTIGPALLNVPASPSVNKTQKVPGRSVNDTTKQPANAKNLTPRDISSPHELTAFVRFSNSDRFERGD